MMRCSAKAYASCPMAHLCGSISEAFYTEGSECAAFNRQQEFRSSPCLVSGEELAEKIVTDYAPDYVSRNRTLMTAVRRLLNEYARAVGNPIVYNPIGYALYKTWQRYE